MTNDIIVEATPTLEGPIQTTAVIQQLERRDVKLADGSDAVYVDFHMVPEHEELAKILNGNAIRVGFPLRLNADTALGQLVKRFGGNPNEGCNLNDMFDGTRVSVIADKEEGRDGGMFWRIDRQAIVPAPAPAQQSL